MEEKFMERQHLNQIKNAIASSQSQTNTIARSSTHPIEELQGAIGNRAVNQLLANQPIVQAKPMFRGLSRELVIQPKLTIGAVGDKYEREADRVATQIVRQMEAPANQPSEQDRTFQRQEFDRKNTNFSHHVVQCMRTPHQSEIKESKQELEEETKQESEEISVSPSSTVLQVEPQPKMKSQWGFGRGKFIVDLNCGWYCEMAAIDYWAKKLNLTLQPDLLPKTTLFGYSPGIEGKQFVKTHSQPTSIKYWQQLLKSEGPVIVSGKLGAAFWLPAGGHFILIVDADVEQNKLKYLDPLQSSSIKSQTFDYMQPRINKIYSIEVKELKKHHNQTGI
jgi:Papain-like cysteine protease AvrRpt2